MCFPASPPDNTAESEGSTAITFVLGLSSFNLLPTPDKVPAVPTPEMKISQMCMLNLKNSIWVEA